jgi:hypothetical protein
MREPRPTPAGEDSCHPPVPKVVPTMADRIHAAMDRGEKPGAHPFLHQSLAQARFQQLPPGHRPMLSLGEAPDLSRRIRTDRPDPQAGRSFPHAFSISDMENAGGKLLVGGRRRMPTESAGRRLAGGAPIRTTLDRPVRENGPMTDFDGDRTAWLRCYRCWSQNLEIQLHYDAIRRVDPETGIPAEGVDEVQESVVQCLDCMHDQPHLTFQGDRVVPIEDRWERMVAGTPWVASCTVTVDQDRVETCSGPDAIEFLTYGAFGDAGVREFFTHVRFHKHDGDRIVVHMLVELYARSAEEASEVLEGAALGPLEITSLAEESRPPAHASDEAH